MDARHPNNIYDRRVFLKLSQAALGQKMGVEASFISTLELGKKSPSLDTIFRLLDALDCGFRDLWPRIESTTNGNGPPQTGAIDLFTLNNVERPQEEEKPSETASNAVLAAKGPVIHNEEVL